MSIQRDERIRFHELGTLHSVTRWICTHDEGIAEWLKNVRRTYQTDRAKVADEHRAALVLMKDADGNEPARLGVLDVGGATLEDVSRWSEWQDFTASGRSSDVSEEQTQGNGAKAYMYKLFSGQSRILGIRDGKLNCKGFDGPPQSLERGIAGFIPDAASARDLPIPAWRSQLAEALRPYNLRIEELPTDLRAAIESRRAFTLVEGLDPKDLYRGRVNDAKLMADLLRHDQVTAVIEQLRIYAVHNGRLLNEGRLSWFSLIWKNRLVELARNWPQVEAVGIVPMFGGGATASSSLFRVWVGKIGSGMCRRSHKSMAAS